MPAAPGKFRIRPRSRWQLWQNAFAISRSSCGPGKFAKRSPCRCRTWPIPRTMRKKKTPAELNMLDIPEPPPTLDPKEHLRIVQAILQGAEPASATKRGQQRQQQVEQKIRQETVALFQWAQTMQVT